MGLNALECSQPSQLVEIVRRFGGVPEKSAPILILNNPGWASLNHLLREIRDSDAGRQAVIFVTSYPVAAEELPRPHAGVTYDLLLIKPLWRMQLYQAVLQLFREDKKASRSSSRIIFAAPKEEAPPEPPARGLKILLAEDNLVNQKVTAGILSKHKHAIDIAPNGAEAVRMFGQKDYDLILMDCQMPEMDGFEATRHIREAEKESGRHIPIIALTASAMIGDRENCLRAGMDSHIAKPINAQELLAAMQANGKHEESEAEN